MLKNYLKTAWRNLTRNKAYAFTNLAGLGIGLAAVMLILLYVQDELSFDRWHPKVDRVYRIVHDAMGPEGKEEKGGSTGGPQAAAFRKEIPEVEDACRYQGGWQFLVKKGHEALTENVDYADNSIFSVFSFPLLEGDPGQALTEETNVVVSEDIARKYFNRTDVIGQTLEINEEGEFKPFRISAVAKNTPLNSSIRFDILLPMERRMHETWTQNWGGGYLNTFVVLRPNANIHAVEDKMSASFIVHFGPKYQEFKKKYPGLYYHYKLQPYLSMHLDKEYNATSGINHWSDATYSYILSGIALFILLIASINFINLSLARSLRRGKEIGIRKVAGGTRGQLMRQFLSESLLLNILAFIPALVLTELCLPAFSQLANKELSVSYLFHAPVLLLFGGLILVNTFLSGFYPALVLSGFNPVQTLYGRFRLTGKNYLGRSLVVLQFTLAVLLITGTLVMQQQFRYMVHKDPGYRTDGMVNLWIPYNDGGKHLAPLMAELIKYPAIRQVGAQSVDFTNENNTSIQVNNKDLYDVPFYRIDAQILSILQVRMTEGRNFYSDATDSLSCIVNQSMVDAAGWKNPVGQKLKWDKKEFQVVGVAKDFHYNSMRQKIGPAFFYTASFFQYGVVLIKTDPARRIEAGQAIQKTFRELYPYYPCNFSFLDELLTDQYKSEKRWMTIVTVAALLSIFISCLGLFGLVSLSVGQRVKEIGVRKVLGAGNWGLAGLLTKSFIQLVVLSFLIAVPLGWYFAQKWLNDFAYRIRLSWELFAMVGLLTLVVALATMSIQSLKAARANPAESLRSE